MTGSPTYSPTPQMTFSGGSTVPTFGAFRGYLAPAYFKYYFRYAALFYSFAHISYITQANTTHNYI